jgi:hypothetical protein
MPHPGQTFPRPGEKSGVVTNAPVAGPVARRTAEEPPDRRSADPGFHLMPLGPDRDGIRTGRVPLTDGVHAMAALKPFVPRRCRRFCEGRLQ